MTHGVQPSHLCNGWKTCHSKAIYSLNKPICSLTNALGPSWQGIRCRWEARREACDYLCLWVTVSALVPLAFFTVRSLSALNLDLWFSSPGVNSHHWEWEWGKQPQSSMATTCNGKPQEHQLWLNPVRDCPSLHDGTYSGPELMTLPLWLPCLGVTSKTTWF